MKIQRLNLDNSWWLQIDSVKLLIDPWLQGTEVDYFKWFNEQWHATPPVKFEDCPDFDLVVISQKYPDHFHLETLKLLDPSKIIGPKSIRKKVAKHLPNAKFLSFHENLKNPFGLPLTLTFLPTNRKIDPIYDSVVISGVNESILVATHGAPYSFDSKKLKNIPGITTILSPLNEYKLPFFLGGTVSPGIEAAEELLTRTGAKHFLQTHDEPKHAKGIVSKFAKIVWAKSSPSAYTSSPLQKSLIEISDYTPIEL